MAYADIYNAANDAAIFQPRCVVAMWTAATAIQNEAANTTDHAIRLDWANRVLRGQVTIPQRVLAALVLQNPTIAANPGATLDADIQFQVNSIVLTLIAIG
jgi:phage tail tape-measure protein